MSAQTSFQSALGQVFLGGDNKTIKNSRSRLVVGFALIAARFGVSFVLYNTHSIRENQKGHPNKAQRTKVPNGDLCHHTTKLHHTARVSRTRQANASVHGATRQAHLSKAGTAAAVSATPAVHENACEKYRETPGDRNE